ncbi:MAG TPA: transglutaminase-like domain-containing protein [Pyrinomonadaceae bacterium]|nr:transglutaminase-like domain-containing protein [Pyrinomonadaceae bacterium]
MTHLKCSQCGLNNADDATVCERCGVALNSEPVTTAPAQSDFPALFTFGTEAPKVSKRWKVILAVVITLALGGGGWALYRKSANSSQGREAKRRHLVERTADERTRDAVLSCIAQPGFVGTNVAEQVLGPVHLELWQVPDKEVYFSAPAPEALGESLEWIVAPFIIDSKRIVMANDDGTGRLRLGKYSLLRSAEKDIFFKTPLDNIKIDSGTVLKFPFKQATYTLDMHELEDFLDNKSIFGGRMNARMEQTQGGKPVIFANHGALVGKPQETSLRRFVDELTRDIQPNSEGAREARVQRVLDFVSQEIKYDFRETTYRFELLKRPNEVLMSRQSDCSNKAILLGSMLEQLGEDYLFVYTPNHITVAVKQGNFPVRNDLFLAWQGEVWLIAEGTVPGFRIGVDRVQEQAQLVKDFKHVQRPRDRDIIFDIATGKQLSFQ